MGGGVVGMKHINFLYIILYKIKLSLVKPVSPATMWPKHSTCTGYMYMYVFCESLVKQKKSIYVISHSMYTLLL